MAIEKNIKINVDTSGAVKEVDNLTGSFKELDKESGKTKKSVDDVASNGGAIAILDQLTGGLATRMKDAYEATKLFNVSLKGTRTALIATGVGAFVVALGLIVAYWDDIIEAIEGANEALETQNELININRGLINQRLKYFEAEKKYNDENNISNDKLIDKQKIFLAQKAKELKIEIDNLEVQYQKELSLSRQQTIWEAITNQAPERTVEEKKALAERKTTLVDLKEELKQTIRAYDELGAVAFITPKKADKKKDEKADDTKIDFDDSALKELEDETRKLEQLAQIRQDFADRNRDNQLAQLEIDRERKVDEINELIEDEIFKEQALLEVNKFYDGEEAKLRDARKLANEKLAQDATDKAISLAQSEANAKKQIQNKLFEVASGLAREGSELGKGIAASQATINTFQGITAALAATSVVPDPIGAALKVANAVAIGVAGFANVKKILSTKPITTSAPSGGAGGSAPAAPSFNLVQGTASNQIADSLQSQNAPVKAFVVSSDVTTSQELDRNIVRDNSL